ncbi:hypothetical protein FHW69_003229 [Luteibacter sp. Sphag1AF]|uniref:hypothetical protein n=1 Tax=Luteibacter sp. Sphag1AF TaxID=2587031 RepID=UPI0016131606|nr:hypothetical protein [Luteibacter sp. Sphag1AF]MBB3228587.1 hypothetical protein [Luteibacter sp. Sphag1AF]
MATSPPALGAHTLLGVGEGSGVSPAVTAPLTTQTTGSSFLVLDGGYISNNGTPADSYGNRWKRVAQVPYGNEYGDRFDVKAYVADNAHGGPDHTVRINKPGEPAGEISVPFIEIRGANTLHAMTSTYAPPALVVTSGAVQTTGPATLIAVWWGDGGVKKMTAEAGDGFTVIDRFTDLPDESGVQVAVATRQVAGPGVWQVTWTAAPVQGALLFLFAFQAP